jgi:hypothetical protein
MQPEHVAHHERHRALLLHALHALHVLRAHALSSLLLAVLLSFFSLNTFGAPPKSTPVKASPGKNRAATPTPAPAGQQAIVKVDSAMVYDIPSFDGAVISYLPAGQKVRISLKTFAAGLGQFYRIMLPNNKIGYIADIDVQPLKKKKSKASKEREKEEEKESEEDSEEEKAKQREEEKKEREREEREEREERAEEARDAARDAQRAPVAFTEYVGPYFASWGFKYVFNLSVFCGFAFQKFQTSRNVFK